METNVAQLISYNDLLLDYSSFMMHRFFWLCGDEEFYGLFAPMVSLSTLPAVWFLVYASFCDTQI